MSFDDAWNKMNERIAKNEKKEGTPIIEIIFNNASEGSGRATLTAPRFHRNEEKTKDDVKRAWETYCRPLPDERLESIIEINLLHKIEGKIA